MHFYLLAVTTVAEHQSDEEEAAQLTAGVKECVEKRILCTQQS